MELDQRSLGLLQIVARFGQASSKQIRELCFPNLASDTPADRTLGRLVERKLLHRVERPLVGGSKGGSGQYIYQLGVEGWRTFFDGRPRLAGAVNLHTIAIVDCYVALVRLERLGALRIVGYLAEPDCHMTIGKHLLKPDLYAEVQRSGSDDRLRLMVEVDMGTQTSQIAEKCQRYWDAYEASDESVWPANQMVVFVAITQHRADELVWMLGRWRKDWEDLFWVRTKESLQAQLSE